MLAGLDVFGLMPIEMACRYKNNVKNSRLCFILFCAGLYVSGVWC